MRCPLFGETPQAGRCSWRTIECEKTRGNPNGLGAVASGAGLNGSDHGPTVSRRGRQRLGNSRHIRRMNVDEPNAREVAGASVESASHFRSNHGIGRRRSVVEDHRSAGTRRGELSVACDGTLSRPPPCSDCGSDDACQKSKRSLGHKSLPPCKTQVRCRQVTGPRDTALYSGPQKHPLASADAHQVEGRFRSAASAAERYARSPARAATGNRTTWRLARRPIP